MVDDLQAKGKDPSPELPATVPFPRDVQLLAILTEGPSTFAIIGDGPGQRMLECQPADLSAAAHFHNFILATLGVVTRPIANWQAVLAHAIRRGAAA